MPGNKARELKIRKQRVNVADGMTADGEIIKGSLIERFTVCRRPGCRCMKGKKHGPYLYISVFDGKQPRQVYVPVSMHAEARKWLRNGKKLSEAVNRLTQLNVELLRLQYPNVTAKGKVTR